MNYLVEEQLLQTLLNYLAAKPYAEVYQLITAIQQLSPVQSEVPSNDG